MPENLHSSPLERYRDIIDDWDAFLDASQRPLQSCIWTNTNRVTPEELEHRLNSDGIMTEPVDWYPGAFRIRNELKIGNRLEYLVGLFHVQEEIAMLPAMLLSPAADDRVLELCAAPGNKLAQMSVMMQNQGTLIANDRYFNRMRPVRQIIDRLGLLNITTTLFDAVSYPKQEYPFDCVMVDVPCSCLGTSRKNPRVLEAATSPDPKQYSRMQTRILQKALQLSKNGAKVLYSTCTYAPEENEMVLQAALDELCPKIQAEIMPVEFPGLAFSPGLSQWRGQQFRSDMHHAMRFYPHQNDTGGFFVALLIKREDGRPPHRVFKPAPEASQAVESNPAEPAKCLEMLVDRFGMPESVLDDLRVFRANAKSLAIVAKTHVTISNPNPQTRGLDILHTNMRYPKITTASALYLGRYATKNIITLDRDQVDLFLGGKSITIKTAAACSTLGDGFVILAHDGLILGVGIYFGSESGGVVHSSFPKAWRIGEDATAFGG